jgi:tRNA1(Val) A37 N6-methylase TrmN6
MLESKKIYVLDKRVELLQPGDGFRTSMDAVMLAAACPAKGGDCVLDMGCGVGTAAFCLLERVKESTVTCVDIQQEVIDIASENAKINGREAQCSFICSDIRDFNVESPDQRFNHIICNPPYMEAGAHLSSPLNGLAIARGHKDMELVDWVKSALRLLKSGGSLTMIHRADVTDRIILAMGKSFGSVEIIPLWPKKDRPAKRVIIRAVKDRKSPASIHSGIIMHKENGDYTDAAESILRDGKYLK